MNEKSEQKVTLKNVKKTLLRKNIEQIRLLFGKIHFFR